MPIYDYNASTKTLSRARGYDYNPSTKTLTKVALESADITPAPPEIVSWADGTPAQIRAMLDAEKAGIINTADYWSVGDARTVHHYAISDSFHSASEQDVVWVLTEKGGKVDENGDEVLWQVDMRDCLEDSVGTMRSASGRFKWSTCDLRTWANGAFRESIPQDFRNLFISTTMRQYAEPMETTYDYFAPRASAEIGAGDRVSEVEAAELSQIPYYASETNRKKKQPSTGNIKYYWVRTGYTGVYALDVDTDGTIKAYWSAHNTGAWYSFFGCIR